MDREIKESAILEFGEFRLQPAERLLMRAGQPVALTPKVFDMLVAFLERPGQLLEKAWLMGHLWPDSFVEESNLTQNIAVLRKALADNPRDPKYIVTVPGRGYRFVAEVQIEADQEKEELSESQPIGKKGIKPAVDHARGETLRHSGQHALATQPSNDTVIRFPERMMKNEGGPAENGFRHVAVRPWHRQKTFLVLAVVAVVAVGALAIYKYRFSESSPPKESITRLAILPLKPLDAGDNYLGLGVADAIIRRISQTGMLTVRPTSSVRRYLDEQTDALTAARQLDADAVLEGTLQRDGDRLRVSVNLLRVSDGRSLWADNYDLSTSDAFAIQDKVAQQVAFSLRLRLDPVQQKRLATSYTPNPIAYEYYLKGLYSFDQRGFNIESKPQHEATIGLFKKSIEADPKFAPAHAELAYAYAWMAVYVDETNQSVWVERAKVEINKADELDPQLAETHIARHHVLLSAHEGFQTESAARELILAKQLNPNVGGLDLAVAYNHLGLEDMFDREMQRTLEIDPTSEFNKRIFGYQLIYAKRYDDWLAYCQKYFDGKPIVPYLLGKGRLDEAQQQIDQVPVNDHLYDEGAAGFKAILSALRGDEPAAAAAIPGLIRALPYKNNSYHHGTYNIACTYALVGKSAEAVKWLRETARTGFPSYPTFERDHYLDPIRRSPEFVQFMAEMKAQNDRLKQEFAQ